MKTKSFPGIHAKELGLLHSSFKFKYNRNSQLPQCSKDVVDQI